MAMDLILCKITTLKQNRKEFEFWMITSNTKLMSNIFLKNQSIEKFLQNIQLLFRNTTL